MADYDLIIRGGQAILPGEGRRSCDLAIKDGRIAAILESGAAASANELVNATGLVVMPGAIDAHLHLGHDKDISRPRVPGDADRETAAAAVGGVTCIVPYLLSTGPYDAIFPEVLAVTAAGARVDFGYHFIISTEEQLEAIPGYIRDHGVPTFKIFMNNRGGEGSRLGLPDIDDGFLFRLCETAAMHGGMVCPHPETIELAWVLRDRVKSSDPDGRGGLRTWNATRPPFVEADAVQRAAYIARQVDAPLYVVHTSSAEALDAALTHRRAGGNIFVETCPHYLTHDETWSGGDIGKINPPLRAAADRERLWHALARGEIDTVGTDHVHRDVGSKTGGIWSASPGCPGLETLLPVLLSEGYHRRDVPLETIAKVTAMNPARIMGLAQTKGSIAPGMDADLAIVDLDKRWTVERGDVVSSAGYSIYEGQELTGKVVHTLVRGRFALRDGALDEGAVGHGRYTRRKLAH